MDEKVKVKEYAVKPGDIVGVQGEPLVMKVFVKGQWYTYMRVDAEPIYLSLAVVPNERMRKAYRELAEYKRLNAGATPSRRELAKVFGSTLTTAQKWVAALEGYGLLLPSDSKHRTLRLTGEVYIPPLAVRGKKVIRNE